MGGTLVSIQELAQFQQELQSLPWKGSDGPGLAPPETFRCFWISFPCAHIIGEVTWETDKTTNTESMYSPLP